MLGTQQISRASADINNMEHIISACDQPPQYSLQLQAPHIFFMFFGRLAGQGSVCSNENHAVIIHRGKAGDNKDSLL